MYEWYEPATDFLWGMPYVEHDANFTDPFACVTTYLNHEIYPSHGRYERNATFYECKTCLTDQNHDPGIGPGLLHGFPAENASYAANVLLRIGPFDRQYSFEKAAMLSVKVYSSMNHSIHFISRIGALTYKEHGEEWFKLPVPIDYELHAARLTARLPILAIIGAQRQLPRVTREHGASEQLFITTVLEVKWRQALYVLIGCLLGQLMAIGVVYWKCKKVFIRDHDSYSSVARVLRTAMDNIEGTSAGSGEALAKALARELQAQSNSSSSAHITPSGLDIGDLASRATTAHGGSEKHKRYLRYGTRRITKDGRDWVEVDLWTDVLNDFPEEGYDDDEVD